MQLEEFKKQIKNCDSKQSVLILASLVVRNPEYLDTVFWMMQDETDKKHWKAAWVLDHVYLEKAALIQPYISSLIALFIKCNTGSIQRIAGKLLTLFNIIDKIDGTFINVCFDRLISPTIPVAVKVHAMQLIFNISCKYPELKPELKITIQEQIPNNTVGFKSRANKLLKKL